MAFFLFRFLAPLDNGTEPTSEGAGWFGSSCPDCDQDILPVIDDCAPVVYCQCIEFVVLFRSSLKARSYDFVDQII